MSDSDWPDLNGFRKYVLEHFENDQRVRLEQGKMLRAIEKSIYEIRGELRTLELLKRIVFGGIGFILLAVLGAMVGLILGG